jgi:hypothetical protein
MGEYAAILNMQSNQKTQLFFSLTNMQRFEKCSVTLLRLRDPGLQFCIKTHGVTNPLKGDATLAAPRL